MAVELVDATKLDACCTAEANAIRTKTGGSSPIAFDFANSKGFADAIAAIPTGGTDYLPGFIMGTLTTYEDDTVTIIRSNAIRGYSALTSLKLHNVTKINSTGIYDCSGLTALAFPNLVGNESVYIASCVNLVSVDLGGITRIGGGSLQANASMNILILRNSSIISLGGVSAFANTPFKSGGAGGTIYIPKSLYDQLGTGTNDYKAASNWSLLDGYGTVTWAQIEGSYYETHYADGTVI